jgi:hypothetical protein
MKNQEQFSRLAGLDMKKGSGVRTLLSTRAWACSLGEKLLAVFKERSNTLLRGRRNKSMVHNVANCELISES